MIGQKQPLSKPWIKSLALAVLGAKEGVTCEDQTIRWQVDSDPGRAFHCQVNFVHELESRVLLYDGIHSIQAELTEECRVRLEEDPDQFGNSFQQLPGNIVIPIKFQIQIAPTMLQHRVEFLIEELNIWGHGNLGSQAPKIIDEDEELKQTLKQIGLKKEHREPVIPQSDPMYRPFQYLPLPMNLHFRNIRNEWESKNPLLEGHTEELSALPAAKLADGLTETQTQLPAATQEKITPSHPQAGAQIDAPANSESMRHTSSLQPDFPEKRVSLSETPGVQGVNDSFKLEKPTQIELENQPAENIGSSNVVTPPPRVNGVEESQETTKASSVCENESEQWDAWNVDQVVNKSTKSSTQSPFEHGAVANKLPETQQSPSRPSAVLQRPPRVCEPADDILKSQSAECGNTAQENVMNKETQISRCGTSKENISVVHGKNESQLMETEPLRTTEEENLSHVAPVAHDPKISREPNVSEVIGNNQGRDTQVTEESSEESGPTQVLVVPQPSPRKQVVDVDEVPPTPEVGSATRTVSTTNSEHDLTILRSLKDGVSDTRSQESTSSEPEQSAKPEGRSDGRELHRAENAKKSDLLLHATEADVRGTKLDIGEEEVEDVDEFSPTVPRQKKRKLGAIGRLKTIVANKDDSSAGSGFLVTAEDGGGEKVDAAVNKTQRRKPVLDHTIASKIDGRGMNQSSKRPRNGRKENDRILTKEELEESSSSTVVLEHQQSESVGRKGRISGKRRSFGTDNTRTGDPTKGKRREGRPQSSRPPRETESSEREDLPEEGKWIQEIAERYKSLPSASELMGWPHRKLKATVKNGDHSRRQSHSKADPKHLSGFSEDERGDSIDSSVSRKRKRRFSHPLEDAKKKRDGDCSIQ